MESWKQIISQTKTLSAQRMFTQPERWTNWLRRTDARSHRARCKTSSRKEIKKFVEVIPPPPPRRLEREFSEKSCDWTSRPGTKLPRLGWSQLASFSNFLRTVTNVKNTHHRLRAVQGGEGVTQCYSMHEREVSSRAVAFHSPQPCVVHAGTRKSMRATLQTTYSTSLPQSRRKDWRRGSVVWCQHQDD